MRILHTSDWHLGDRLGARRIERRPHLQQSLNQLARYLDEYKVDVMIVSGDVFSDQLRLEERREAVKDIKDAFRPFLDDGGTILVISGNHDSEIFFETLHDTLDLVAGGRSGPLGTDPTGRLYAYSYGKIVKLADRQQRQTVQFVLMPYPTARRYLRGENIRFDTIEEKHLKLKTEFTKTFNILADRHVDPKLPCVLVSHVHVSGVTMPHTLFRPTEADNMLFGREDLPTGWAYVACGHIHKPQAIFTSDEHVRYAGSIERLDLGETNDDKSAVLVEIEGNQRVGVPQVLPLNATALYRVDVTDLEQIPLLRKLYPDADKALVKYFLTWDASKGYNRDDVRREIERIFPNWYDWELVPASNSMGQSVISGPSRVESVRDTVVDYLKMKVREDDPLRDKLLERAAELLTRGGY